jgi:hypothetical protein
MQITSEFESLTKRQKHIISDLITFMCKNPDVVSDASSLVINSIVAHDDFKSSIIPYKRYKSHSKKLALQRKLNSCEVKIKKYVGIKDSIERKIDEFKDVVHIEHIGSRRPFEVIDESKLIEQVNKTHNLMEEIRELKKLNESFTRHSMIGQVMTTINEEIHDIDPIKLDIIIKTDAPHDPIKMILNVNPGVEEELKVNHSSAEKQGVKEISHIDAIRRFYLLEKNLSSLIKFLEGKISNEFLDPFKQEWSMNLSNKGRCKAIELAIRELIIYVKMSQSIGDDLTPDQRYAIFKGIDRMN